MIDLHIHTNNSDGTENVIEVLKRAEEQNLSYISITDHESVNGHYELREINIKDYYSGKVIPGVELKNYYKDRVIDILAYNLDIDKSIIAFFDILYTRPRKNVSFSYIIDKTLKLCYCKCMNLGKVTYCIMIVLLF